MNQQESKYDVFIIEGIDRLGKDTLIKNIQNELGYHFVIHYSKPEKLKYYNDSLQEYQLASFENGFALIENCGVGIYLNPLIFNRFHLGECVYAPLYRGYDGKYVFQLEENFEAWAWTHAKLILLTTSDFSIITDDGESFDFSKKEDEQEMFKAAFETSILPNKVMIDVSNGKGGFKTPQEILQEALA